MLGERERVPLAELAGLSNMLASNSPRLAFDHNIYLSWFLVDCGFELGQKCNNFALKIIPHWFPGIPFLENTEAYFLQETFDTIDLAAIAFGTLIAYFSLFVIGKRRALS